MARTESSSFVPSLCRRFIFFAQRGRWADGRNERETAGAWMDGKRKIELVHEGNSSKPTAREQRLFVFFLLLFRRSETKKRTRSNVRTVEARAAICRRSVAILMRRARGSSGQRSSPAEQSLSFLLTRGIIRILSELSPRRSIEIDSRCVVNGVGRGSCWLMCVFFNWD